ncbi:TolC family protein [Rhodohalobacter sp. 614A]|uniref:TolC family protein n=1 Tax=Rhodohalobacter sp. 614A TaxID=2908649 RepID=UPI001F2DEF99|nr:TolC family protein [Rhodohalobacter sp. 614A]
MNIKHLKINLNSFTLYLKSVALVIIVAMASQIAVAQNTTAVPDSLNNGPVIDLTQAIQIALANNTQMKRALLTVRDADQQVRTAWSEVMPSVSASANYTRNLEVPVNFIPAVIFDPEADPNDLMPVAFGTDNNWQGGLSVSQTIFSGQAFVGISSSEVYKAAQSENLRATSQGVVTQTRLAYHQVLIAKEQVRLIEAQMSRIEDNLNDTQGRYEEGFVDDYAVTQLEVQLGNLQPQLTGARFSVNTAKRELLDILGLPLHLPIDLKGELNTYNIFTATVESEANESLKKVDKSVPIQLERDSLLAQQAFDLRGDLRILGVQQQLQDRQLKAQRSQYLPTLSANYNLQWTASQPGTPNFFGTEDQRARSQTVMLSLSVPIFQGFSRDAAIERTKIQLKDLEIQENQTKQTARKEILSAQQGIEQAFETIEAQENVLEQAREGYERALVRYQNGVGSQAEVTDADLQLRQAENSYAQTVFNYLNAKAQYDQALGQVPFVGKDVQEIKNNIELN